MWKKMIVAGLLSLCCVGQVHASAFSPEVTALTKEEIVKLTDEKLIDTYMDTVVDIDAVRMFHTTSGFSPKDYKEFKDLLKFRMRLLLEIHSRNLELPQLDMGG